MNFQSLTDIKKALRVWWNSNGVVTYYYIDKIEEAQLVIDILSIRELNDEQVDFNISGIEVFEDNEWTDWFSDEGLDYEAYIEQQEEECKEYGLKLESEV